MAADEQPIESQMTGYLQRAFGNPVRALRLALVDQSKRESGQLLGDAAQLPEEGQAIATAEQFAARWNSLDAEQRQAWLDGIRDDSRWAHRCFVENHDGTLAAVRESARARSQRLSQLPGVEAIVNGVLVRYGIKAHSLVGGQRLREILTSVLTAEREALR